MPEDEEEQKMDTGAEAGLRMPDHVVGLLAKAREEIAARQALSRTERIVHLDRMLARLSEQLQAAHGNKRLRTEIFRARAHARLARRHLEQSPCE